MPLAITLLHLLQLGLGIDIRRARLLHASIGQQRVDLLEQLRIAAGAAHARVGAGELRLRPLRVAQALRVLDELRVDQAAVAADGDDLVLVAVLLQRLLGLLQVGAEIAQLLGEPAVGPLRRFEPILKTALDEGIGDGRGDALRAGRVRRIEVDPH